MVPFQTDKGCLGCHREEAGRRHGGENLNRNTTNLERRCFPCRIMENQKVEKEAFSLQNLTPIQPILVRLTG